MRCTSCTPRTYAGSVPTSAHRFVLADGNRVALGLRDGAIPTQQLFGELAELAFPFGISAVRQGGEGADPEGLFETHTAQFDRHPSASIPLTL